MMAHSTIAQDNTPKYSNEFINIGVDARAFGMGLSMVSHVQDVSAGYWNPAGLVALQSDYQLELMHSAYFGGISNYDYGAFAARLDADAALSISLIRFAVDDIPDTRLLFDANGAINYDNIKFFSAADYGMFLSYAREFSALGGIRFGSNVKVIRRIVGDFAGSWGFGMDAGFQKSWNKWNLGLVVRDIFGTFNSWSIQDDQFVDIYATTQNNLYSQTLEITLPRLILGTSRTFTLHESLQLLTSLDITATTDGPRNTVVRSDVVSLDPALGFEFGYKSVAFLRGGIGQFQQIKDFEGSQSWTFQPNLGLGFKIQEVAIDYAFTDLADQAAGLYSHVFSVKVNFNVE